MTCARLNEGPSARGPWAGGACEFSVFFSRCRLLYSTPQWTGGACETDSCGIFDRRSQDRRVGVAIDLSPRPACSCSSIGRNLRTSLVPANAPSPRAAGAPLSSSLRSRCKNRSSRYGALSGALTSNCTCMHVRQIDRSIRCVPTTHMQYLRTGLLSSRELECKGLVFPISAILSMEQRWMQLHSGAVEAYFVWRPAESLFSHARTRLFSQLPILACAHRSLKPPQPDFLSS